MPNRKILAPMMIAISAAISELFYTLSGFLPTPANDRAHKNPSSETISLRN